MAAKKILIVEDEIIASKDLQARLKNWGYETLHTSYGEEAVQIATTLKPDLILMDIMLKGQMDGIQAAEFIKSEINVPILFITAYQEEDVMSRAQKVGPFAYMIKPFDEKFLKINLSLAFYRAEIEEKTRNEKEKYQLIFQNIQDIYYEVSLDGTILEISPSVENFTLYYRDEILGKNMNQFYSDLNERQVFLQKLLEMKQLSNYEIKLKNKNGKKMIGSINCKLIFNDKREPVKIIGIIREITEAKEIEERLREGERKLRLISMVENFPSAAVYTYKDKLLLNEHTEKITGYLQDEIVSVGEWFSKLYGKNADQARTNYMKNKEKGFEESQTIMITKKNGEPRLIDFLAYSSPDGEIWFLNDMTEIRQTAQRIQAQNIHLQFLAQTAHDFIKNQFPKTIYHYIGEKIHELFGNSVVIINRINEKEKKLHNQAIIGLGKFTHSLMTLIGGNPEGMVLKMNDNALSILKQESIYMVPDLYDFVFEQIPLPVCKAIEKLFGVHKIYVIGFMISGELIGNAGIITLENNEIENPELLKAFVNQAAIALLNLKSNENLTESEESLSTLINTIEDFIFVIGNELQIKNSNKAFSDFLRMPKNQLIGSHINAIGLPETIAKKYIESCKRIFSQGKTIHCQDEYPEQNNRKTIFHTTLTPIWNQEKEIKGIAVITRNIKPLLAEN